MKFLYTFFFACFSILAFGQTAVVKGTLIDRTTEEPYPFENVVLMETNDTVRTDYNGEFSFDSLTPGRYTITVDDSHLKDHPRDVVFRFNVTTNEITEVVVKATFDCVYDAHKDDKRCPECHKEDKVIPISYGLLIGEIPKKHGKEIFYDGGCELTGCDPHWHCRRDGTNF